MTVNGSRIPPGPKGFPIVGVSFELLGDALGLLRRVARGEISEIAGPRGLPLDVDSRTLGMMQAADTIR